MASGPVVSRPVSGLHNNNYRRLHASAEVVDADESGLVMLVLPNSNKAITFKKRG
jgi:dUTPase